MQLNHNNEALCGRHGILLIVSLDFWELNWGTKEML